MGKEVKARDIIINKNYQKKKKNTYLIHNGKILKERKVSKSSIGYLGELSSTKKTGKIIHNNNKKKKKKMKKHGIDLFLKNSRTLWKKSITKNTKIKARIIAGNAQKKPPLSSMLASIGINADNFINAFNTQTGAIFGTEGVLLSTKITITPAKTFEINWSLPSIYSLFKKIFQNWDWDNQINEDEFKKIIVAISYKIALLTVKRSVPTQKQIYGKLRQTYGSILSWDIFQLANHNKDKKRQKKKK